MSPCGTVMEHSRVYCILACLVALASSSALNGLLSCTGSRILLYSPLCPPSSAAYSCMLFFFHSSIYTSILFYWGWWTRSWRINNQTAAFRDTTIFFFLCFQVFWLCPREWPPLCACPRITSMKEAGGGLCHVIHTLYVPALA